ncbi:MAG: hypothetical protein LN569_02565 [Rickettsia endosymbiont of Labidopullus appendiculatus]|nr:hypothetical protein [Rickettsia endosymbiont of Labidopullus appendiculatus]
MIYSSALKNWNVKQGVSERSVHLVHEYANTPKFYGANSSKQKSIPKFTANDILLKGFLADSRKIKGLPCVLISLTPPSSALSHWLLLNYFVNSAITKKREDIVNEIASHDNADDKFSECLINLVELASGAAESFKGSTIEGKHKLINLVFVNLEIKAGKLNFKLRPPFDTFVKCTKIE